MIEFDVETRGLQWYDQPGQQVFMAQFFDPEDEDCPVSCPDCGREDGMEAGECPCGSHQAEAPQPVILRHPEDREEIQRWLDKDSDFRAWNSKFDLHHLEAAGYTLPPEDRWHDGLLMAHAIDERRMVGLQAVGDSMFGEGAEAHTEKAVKDWLKAETARRRKVSKETGKEFRRPNYSHVPDEIMVPYAAHDVTLQRSICDRFEPMMADVQDIYDLEREVMPALFDVERRGFKVDAKGARIFERELEKELDELEGECKQLAGDEEFNPGSGAQIGRALEARGADLSVVRKLKSGLPATDKDALASVTDDLARKVEAFRNATKLYSTYVWPLLNPDFETDFGYRAPYIAADGRLHTDLRQVGARTGRMSSSPNVQNWPRDDLRMRHLVQASEGHKLIAVDLDSIELRVFAAFVGQGKLLEMMKDPDADLHTYTAKMVGLRDYDRGGGAIESARQRGKKLNYSIIYGAGTRSLMAAFHITQKEAREMLWAYHETFPEVQEFQARIERTLEDRGYVRTPFGRKHRVRDQRHADREAYKFGNYLVQGTAADLFKLAVVRCYKLGIPMVALTHDEILADVPEADVEQAADTIKLALCDHPKITKMIPLDAEAIICDRWSQAKDPDFDPGWN